MVFVVVLFFPLFFCLLSAFYSDNTLTSVGINLDLLFLFFLTQSSQDNFPY